MTSLRLPPLFTRPAAGPEDLLTGPIRGELLGAEHLAERARTLARAQRLAARPSRHRARLLVRLDETSRLIEDAHQRLAAAADREINVSPAGEWLLDNLHVVQEHIREVRDSLPRGYYRELPELAGGALAGYPRVYEIAITLISHTEARVELENVELFLGAYQQVRPLVIGELWSIPAMVRLGLIESVRRMALRTVGRLTELELADEWADQLLGAGEEDDAGTTAALHRFVSEPPSLTPTFVARLLTRLRGSSATRPPLFRLEHWIAEHGMHAEEAAARSTERVALTQLTMANSITSLRGVARMDWESFVERQSAMEAVLREDPAGVYGRMTFATRDQYRHVVERIAKRGKLDEPGVARAAIERAVASPGDGSPEARRRRHVGYWLVDQGLPELERACAFRPPAGLRLHRWVLRHPNVVFVGGVLAGTVAAIVALLWLAGPEARRAWPLVLLFALIPANDIAVVAMNQLITTFLPPRRLPKLDLGRHGVPEELRTVVVVPTLFGSTEAVHEALEHLEVQYLANREPHLQYAILSDFTDAAAESLPADAAILQAAEDGVRALNAQYARDDGDVFFLFHRPRRYNPSQGVWMGWERKRGKLAEFNRFLRGADGEAFNRIVGDPEPLRRVRYVITLDADTLLPPDTAVLLIGALAHPLNRAVYDPARGRVVRGYGILQPRVGVSLPSAHRSQFAAVHSGHPGVDPYTTAVSDVYQDLYGEGSFTGKGIYDVDAFERATHGRFPENTLLSHDLIEGNYARAGLVSDIVVYDDYPTRYLTYTRRKHRWIRGDWQLLRWLTPRVPGPDGPERNRLSLLSRWKILDNLRRSTVELAQLALLVAGWTILPGGPLRWTLLVLGAIAAGHLVAALIAVVQPPMDKSWRAYYAAVSHDIATSLQQVALAITFLPHQAWVSGDAILRTLWRLGISRRQLLEWQTASQTERIVSPGPGAAWRTMWPAVVLPVALLAVALVAGRGIGRHIDFAMLLGAAGPLVVLWAISPAVAHAISAPAVRRERRLPSSSRATAMRYALLHWRYFDRFVTADTHWLAPDNFQEDPVPVVAMRTSPTNIGLQLLATVSACDLGFITAEDMTDRLERTFASLETMRRFRGHWYNWYDLRDLHVLEPAYISTVDSGNLAGHLLAVQQACLGFAEEPVFDARTWRALRTGLQLAQERVRRMGAADSAGSGRQALGAAEAALREADAALVQSMASDPGSTLARVIPALDRARVAVAQATPIPAAPAIPTANATAGGPAGAAPVPDEPVDPVEAPSEWIDWCYRLAEGQQARLEGLELRAAVGRGARPVSRSESWRSVAERSPAAALVISRLARLAERASEYMHAMDFGFLYDRSRSLFAIGYLAGATELDGSHYDLLASEARLASFLAVARNQVPVEHWFRLGRTLTRAAGATALVSWSGSMFEYLMPGLVMRSFPFTVLHETLAGAVRRQMAYASERRVPWGISESAYNLRDRYQTYQYRAFGVPDLALKRGLGRDLVIAPYATALAAMIAPQRGIANLSALEKLGALGRYGFYESLDYTRPDPGRPYGLVRAYMAHHVGMSLVALTNTLTAQLWQRRFHEDPMVRSVELLLHEQAPRRLELQEPQASRAEEALPDPELERPVVREVGTPDTPAPHVALLGHLPYTVMVSHCGAGYSRFEELAVTRWRADSTRDATGQFCYLRDLADGRTWSAAHQPVCAPADRYRAYLATDRVTVHRTDGPIETRTEIAVLPADAAEVRRVTVTNYGSTVREIELTSYGEIVLAPPDSDRAHPAFGNLFVETEYHDWCTAITATRRPRSAQERPLWCVHVVDDGPERVHPVSCETDRSRFLGRGRTPRDPAALEQPGPLSGTTGAVLDPIFALRTRVRLEPRQSASVAFTTLVATTRERAFELADRYHHPRAAQRALDLAWTSAQVELRELDISPAEAGVFQELAGSLFYSNATLRASQEELRRNRGSQPLLWTLGVSGDWPILLALIDSPEGLPTLRHLLAAHHYWRRRGMMVDLVVLNLRPTSYLTDLDQSIMTAVQASHASGMVDQPGGVFVRRRDRLPPDVLAMLRATARVHIECDGRALGRVLTAAAAKEDLVSEDLASLPAPTRSGDRGGPRGVLRLLSAGALGSAQRTASATVTTRAHRAARPTAGQPRPPGGADGRANGFGGVTADGDYEIVVAGDHAPPMPWINVVANPHGGFLVSERGGGYAWAGNSHFYRLTPWYNDPVGDPPTEALYLRDEDTGAHWCPTPAPLRSAVEYSVRHGPGLTTFESRHGAVAASLTLGLAADEAVKLSLLRLENRGDTPVRLTLTAYTEWCLGALREHTQHQVHTSWDPDRRAILAWNSFDPDFAGQVAFFGSSEPVVGHTADRREFLGRNGTVEVPDGLAAPLAGTTGNGIDPCAALRSEIRLDPGQTKEIALVLGAAEGAAAAREALERFGDAARARAAVDAHAERWRVRLAAVTVRTPEPQFDVMLNRWLLYQALACRMWARSGLYQSSGAYGFRDQLQDIMALVYAEPALAREHILRSAGRQFVEGDVQHWWHPPAGRGVRTRFSDDLAWLPFVVDHYVRVTGDGSVLDEMVPFLTMRQLEPHEHEVYDLPSDSGERGSIYQHCLRALRRATTTGVHGLPLIGIGDWNDGMNRVGVEGRGESVWLAWFLIATLRRFADDADARDDGASAATWRAQADGYARAVETEAWDGEWYQRAYFDDGTPLGSARSDECRIDSIAQSWSVISGAGDPARQAQAMRSLERYLVRNDVRVLPLLTPPFDHTPNDPGYIKGYLPGVRENGAQYTHAALWAVLATALQGDGDRAFELFQMINPLTRTGTPGAVAVYQVEPYVVAADVYTAEGHVGRGGWTWYTGSASWMYRVGLEGLLGFTRRGDRLTIEPRVPASWPEYTIEYRHGTSRYTITVERPGEARPGRQQVLLDGHPLAGEEIPLADDGMTHRVVIRPAGR
ncbi:MAG TPA: glucoamylase family protein [Gemmatimonadales bacterium]|nr:glucoamylase family protein [Gemmatimonadales bacterium]